MRRDAQHTSRGATWRISFPGSKGDNGAMSNPLLQPDGRFRRPSVVDAAGRNRFADEGETAPAESSGDLLAPPAGDADPVYQPHYQAIVTHRGGLIAGLGVTGFAMSWMLLLAYTNYAYLGLAASFFGIALSLGTSIIGYHDLKGMSLGAIDERGRDSTLLGFRFALAGIFVGGGALIAVIWLIVKGWVELGL
jgi:hypothetical protein